MAKIKVRVKSSTPKVDEVRERNVKDLQTEMSRLLMAVDHLKKNGTIPQMDRAGRILRAVYTIIDEDCQ